MRVLIVYNMIVGRKIIGFDKFFCLRRGKIFLMKYFKGIWGNKYKYGLDYTINCGV